MVNSAMMQVSSYHKQIGDQVSEYSPLLHNSYDKIYAFSIFDFTPKHYVTKDMIVGGTGFDPKITLPPEMEDCFYDWSIYPNCDFSIIWFSRGCIRDCPFCIVREKEGYIHAVEPNNLNPNGTFIKVMDNNFFASPKWRQAIKQLQEWNQPVDFQGVDVRLLDEEQCQALNSLTHRHQIHIAWDFPEIDLTEKIKEVTQWIKPYKLMCYVLTGYNSTPEEDLYRVEKLRELKVDPFVMVYNKNLDPFLVSFARWVNRKELFKSCSWNEFYSSYKTHRFDNPLAEVFS
ncbi:MAG: hypothetical protein KAU62_03140 [Candidatus Heimdallarchaeota archaeon]|nr:hypothetical protein [Candidatus Heimdallarchaeota archaeon]MCK4610132.1 hypothetical protein [Candidatus Heimdallarchaeota archaeon]